MVGMLESWLRSLLRIFWYVLNTVPVYTVITEWNIRNVTDCWFLDFSPKLSPLAVWKINWRLSEVLKKKNR
jgi:hypothetical protein